MFALPVLLFIAQLSEFAESVFEAESTVMKMLFPGPGNWVKIKVLWNLDRFFLMALAFPSCRDLSLAVRMRVRIKELPTPTFYWKIFGSCV